MPSLATGFYAARSQDDGHATGNVIFELAASNVAALHAFAVPSGKAGDEVSGLGIEPTVNGHVTDATGG